MLLLTVAIVMAAMGLVMSAPAFAHDLPPQGEERYCTNAHPRLGEPPEHVQAFPPVCQAPEEDGEP